MSSRVPAPKFAKLALPPEDSRKLPSAFVSDPEHDPPPNFRFPNHRATAGGYSMTPMPFLNLIP
jgi:hypothetical protein